jgi:branched-chain amino acid transport system ATP-binding protein
MSVLATTGLSCGYGASVVVREVSLRVDAGEVVALLGANGAGKTTTLLTLAGVLPVIDGTIEMFGQRVDRWAAPQVARHGTVLIPDDRGLFPKLTIRENLTLAMPRRGVRGDPLELFPELQSRMGTPAGLLSGGEQQMLAIARALVREPRLLLIDELSFGLAPLVVRRLLPVLRRVVDETGCGVLLVEQHVHLGLEVAQRAYVLSHGNLVLEGTAEQLRDDLTLLQTSYLGEVDPSSTSKERMSTS